MELGGRREYVEKFDEQGITTALYHLLQNRPETLYFLRGHGEDLPSTMTAATATISLPRLLVMVDMSLSIHRKHNERYIT
ncbi:MAG: hypothetical protein R3C68_15175 [Myxococcota bacterium]